MQCATLIDVGDASHCRHDGPSITGAAYGWVSIWEHVFLFSVEVVLVWAAIILMDYSYSAPHELFIDKRLVGGLARLLKSIPVERAQDLAFAGAGTVWLSPEDGVSLLGRGTRFSEQLRAGDTVSWKGVSGRVAAVASANDGSFMR
mgnify:CR=1 FL=1